MPGTARTSDRPASETRLWFPFRRESDRARVRLFCVPHAGAGAAAYLEWARRLPPEIEVCATELPGRGARGAEPPYHRLEPLTHRLCDVVRPLLDRPYLLHGHSMGALVAFELARLLQDMDVAQPSGLLVTGMVAPPRWPVNPPVHHLPPDQLVVQATRFLELPPDLAAEEDVLALLLPTLRTDLELAETYRYRPGPPLRCPVVALAGARDESVPLSAVQGWGDVTTGRFGMRVFDGGHFFLHECPDVLNVVATVATNGRGA